MDYYALFIIQNEAYILAQKKDWQTLKIEGEDSIQVESDNDAQNIIKKLDDIINHTNQLQNIVISITYDDDSAKYIASIITTLTQLKCQSFIVVPFHHLTQSYPSNDTDPLTQYKYLANFCFFKTPLTQQSIVESKAFSQDTENKTTTFNNQPPNNPTNMEENWMLSFLPIIYRNFWNNIKPYDVALLMDSVNPPQIPSPYPEPSSETIFKKTEQFKSFPENKRKELLAFCKNRLPDTLTIRPECKRWFSL